MKVTWHVFHWFSKRLLSGITNEKPWSDLYFCSHETECKGRKSIFFTGAVKARLNVFCLFRGVGGVDGKRECISREQTIIAIHFILFGLAKE